MKMKCRIKNTLLLTILVTIPVLLSIQSVNADTIEDEFLSVVNKYNIEDIVVEDGILLEKGETLDLSKYPKWDLSDNETVEINSNGILKAVNEGTVFLSKQIGEKVYILEIYVPKKSSMYNLQSIDVQPRSYYKVFIDPGHGGSDPGALGYGYKESDLNLQIAKKVENNLKAKGIDVKMSRSTDVYHELAKRAEMANGYGADVFVSIHQNSAESTSANGIETYYNRNRQEDKPFSNDIQVNLIKQTSAKDRKVKEAGFVVLKETNMTASLVECGFISNQSEAQKLSTSSYQDKVAKGISDGIEKYLKENVIIEESKIIAKGSVIKTDSLNIRKGPSTSFDIIGKLNGGDKINIVSKIDNWYKIEYNNTYGYVSSYYIEIIKDSQEENEDQETPNIEFNDVDNNHWAYSEIQAFIEKGYIDGYEDGTFKPENPIKRNEFVKIFNKLFGLTEKSGVVFEDTKDNWAKEEIDIAVTNGVAEGVSDTLFEPERYMTRQEAAKMLSNYMQLDDKNHDEIKKFPDYNQIDEWAKDALEGNVKKGYIRGIDDRILAPKKNMTRAEVVTLLSRVDR